MHDDFTEVGRGVSGGCRGTAEYVAEALERFCWSPAAVLGQPALVVHVGTETRAEYAAQPAPLVQAGRGREVGHDLLDVPLPAQSAVPPLLCSEARQVLCQGVGDS